MSPATDDTTRSSKNDNAMKTLRLAVFVPHLSIHNAPTTIEPAADHDPQTQSERI
jgi:hypothetical protein